MKENNFRKAMVLYKGERAGILEEIADGYRFTYDENFMKKNVPISLSISLNRKIHESKNLFSFFEGLLPEGWYLEIVSKTLKIDKNDSFGILLATANETMGAVSIKNHDKEK